MLHVRILKNIWPDNYIRYVIFYCTIIQTITLQYYFDHFKLKSLNFSRIKLGCVFECIGHTYIYFLLFIDSF